MIKPMIARFYIYAESDAEISELERSLHDFVATQYEKGAIVTAAKLAETLRTFGSSPIITQYINGK